MSKIIHPNIVIKSLCIIFIYIIVTKTCKILHYSYHNICMLLLTYFIAVDSKEILMSAT